MNKKHCHFARIRYCPDLTASGGKHYPAFEVILWTHPELVVEVTQVDPFPEITDLLTREVADQIGPMAIELVELMVADGMAPPLIMARLGRHITGSFYVSGIGEEVRKTRDSAA